MPRFRFTGIQKVEFINGRPYHVTPGFVVDTAKCPGVGWVEEKHQAKSQTPVEDKTVAKEESEDKGLFQKESEGTGETEHAPKPHTRSKSKHRPARKR